MFRILKNVVDEHQAKPPLGEGNSSKVTRNKQVLMFVFQQYVKVVQGIEIFEEGVA